MFNEIEEEWLQRLESPNYTKFENQLANPKDLNSCCCLGHYAAAGGELAGSEEQVNLNNISHRFWDESGAVVKENLTAETIKFLEEKTGKGITSGVLNWLSNINDMTNISHEDLAKVIRMSPSAFIDFD